MSSNFWQTRRQTEQYSVGLTLTQKVEEYCRTWEGRCYDAGIPDEAPGSLLFSGRVPSFKAIALCILSNDLHLRRIGFDWQESELCRELRVQAKRAMSPQTELALCRK